MILGAEPVTLRRYVAGSVDSSGDFAAGSSTDSTIQAAVQPLPGRDRQLLPEGDRQREAVKIFTKTALQTADQSTGVQADRIVVDGVRVFEVFQVARWRQILPHYEAIAVRVGEAL